MADLDSEKIAAFVGIARAKRGFPFSAEAASETILTHLNLMVEQRLTNAAILLFAKNPQQFFISSEIKCAHFQGTTITKPIPSYHVYKGDVFQLVNQAVDFVLSRIDVSVGTHDQSIQVPIHYELPPAAVTEAIFNAGSLSYGLTTAKLRKPHSSIPANPLLAEPMYLAGFIERMGTGTGDIILLCEEAGLKKPPEFLQEEIFKTILWRKNAEDVVAVGVSGGVNDILVLIENHPGINVSALKSHLDIPQRTIERWINQLKKENKIEFKGAPKTGGIIG
jgi:ATP-dependent DNA helicase RecG